MTDKPLSLAKHEVRRVENTVLVRNLENESVVQLNGTAGEMFSLLSQSQVDGQCSKEAIVAKIVSLYPEMQGREDVVSKDFDEFIDSLKGMGLVL